MLRHHEAALDHALDRLYLDDAVSIEWDDPYIWFNVDRIGKNVYREILQQWVARCEYYGYSTAPPLHLLTTTNLFPYRLRITRDPFPYEKLESFESFIK